MNSHYPDYINYEHPCGAVIALEKRAPQKPRRCRICEKLILIPQAQKDRLWTEQKSPRGTT